MVFTPNSKIFLLNTVLCEDQNNQLDFTSITTQTSYFLSKVVGSFSYEDCTYVRKDNVLKVPASLDQLWNVNYVMYQNTMFTNKWFYCFIVGRRYINDNCTELTLKTDVFQTWMFDYDILPSFVEREHVEDDTIGKHTIPEGLETGEYINNGNTEIVDNFQSWSYVVNVTAKPDGEVLLPTVIGGIVSAGGFYGFNGSNSQDVIAFTNFISSYDARADAIVNVYIVPSALIDDYIGTDHKITLANVKTFTKNINKPSTIDGYTPKNNKVLTFPYQYLLLTNGNGSNNILHYERFSENQATFEIKGLATTGGSTKIYPTNYKGANYEEGLIAGKYPSCSWGNDMFINWLTQNGVNVGLGIGSSILSTGVGIATGNPIGISSGILSVASSLGEVYKHTFIPPSAQGNINGGDVLTSTGMNTFIFYKMSIKQEYAKIIDKFFSMFGYKVNEVKSPNLTSRQNWNYIKTSNVIIEAQAPDEDIDELKKIFNKGITIWHNPATFGDYSQSNNIV